MWAGSLWQTHTELILAVLNSLFKEQALNPEGIGVNPPPVALMFSLSLLLDPKSGRPAELPGLRQPSSDARFAKVGAAGPPYTRLSVKGGFLPLGQCLWDYSPSSCVLQDPQGALAGEAELGDKAGVEAG